MSYTLFFLESDPEYIEKVSKLVDRLDSETHLTHLESIKDLEEQLSKYYPDLILCGPNSNIHSCPKVVDTTQPVPLILISQGMTDQERALKRCKMKQHT